MNDVDKRIVAVLLAGALALGSLVTLGARGMMDERAEAWTISDVSQTPAAATPEAIRAFVPYQVEDAHNTTWCVSSHNGHTFPPITQP
jgi:hypothetical protein